MLTLLKSRPTSFCYWIVAAIGLVFFGVSDIWAADPIPPDAEHYTGFLDSMADKFETTAKGWEYALRQAAAYVFRVLLLVDIVYISFDCLLIRGEDIRTWAGEMLRQAMIIGFFSWVLFNSSDIANVIFKGFEQLAGIAAGQSAIDAASPSRILDVALENSRKMQLAMTGMNGWGAFFTYIAAIFSTIGIYSWFVVLVTMSIIIVYCMIACRVLITQIEVYISLSCGIVVLAFGGSRWTREPAIRYCWFLMALALKLFTIYMLISIGDSMMHSLFFDLPSGSLKENLTMWFLVIGILLIWVVIIWVIPNSVAQLVSHIGGVGGGGAAGASAAAGLIGGSLAFAGSSVANVVKAAGVAATPATAGGGLAVSAAIAAGEKAMQAGVGMASKAASYGSGSEQGGSGGNRGLVGIAKGVGPGSSGTSPAGASPRSSPQRSGGGTSSSPSSTGSSAKGSAASGSSSGAGAAMAASAGTAALGGIAKGITGTVSGAASLGARGDLGAAKATDGNLGQVYQPKENLKPTAPKPNSNPPR